MSPATLRPRSRSCNRPAETDAALLVRLQKRREADALTTLVLRHGPMVLGVCRRVLGMGRGADEVFCQTFRLVVRKTHRIRHPELLASQLYRTAYTLALRAKTTLALHGQRAGQVLKPWQSAALAQQLDAELNRLPEKYRAPLVLCCLEGKRKSEAARRLGWARPIVYRHLISGRDRLLRRLKQRGQAVSPAALERLLLRDLAAVAVPPDLVLATLRVAGVAADASPVAANVPQSTANDLWAEICTPPAIWQTRGSTKRSFITRRTLVVLGGALLTLSAALPFLCG